MPPTTPTADSLYARQDLIGQVKPVESAIVIGTGGVGYWVALALAMTGTKKLFLIDFDNVEESNRSRIPFKKSDVGKPKIMALANFINEIRHGHCEVVPLEMRCEKVPPMFRNDPAWKTAAVYDCRDNTDELPDFYNKCRITGGYDGLKMSLHRNPNNEDIFGNGPTRYTITPSYAIMPMLLAAMIVGYSTIPSMQKETDLDSTFTFQELVNHKIFNEAAS